MGYLDEDGYLFLVDRKKDVILRGGYSVYPRELEDVLLAHPSILEAVALGVPDDRLGEEVVAVVVPRPGQHLRSGRGEGIRPRARRRVQVPARRGRRRGVAAQPERQGAAPRDRP